MVTEIEDRVPFGIGGRVGPVRHAVGAHALAELPHASQQNRHLGRRKLVVGASREQVLAGVLGRLVLGTTYPELLRGREFCVGGACLGVGEVRHAL